MIRESQETEAHKVNNKENQASGDQGGHWSRGAPGNKGSQDPLGTRGPQASPASLAPPVSARELLELLAGLQVINLSR